MSAHYALIPLEPIEPAWLVKMGLVIPENYENSRNPTAAEVRSVVRQIADENVVELRSDFCVAGDDLDAILVAGEDDTFLSVGDYAKDHNEDTPRHISFTYGSAELVLTVCERLAQLCGPFLLTMDGAFFVIVSAGIPPNADWVSADF